ncbi:pyrroline-5-carboxylate reductase [Spirosomataceae bacterium TFI 002]|nr:pyrroline-5-carboxylate reductase [Spirosomataceae bacterium TFI 002]
MKLLVIGAGNMGMSYAEGIAKSDIAIEKPILLLDADEAKITTFNKDENYKGYTVAKDVIGQADYILMAVKPQHFKALAADVHSLLKPSCTIISIMAGVTVETIANATKLGKVARAMPNLPAQIGLGMTTVNFTDAIDEPTKEIVKAILSSTGEVLEVAEQQDLDKSTGISGSGPAYIFYFIEALEKAAEGMGFNREDSRKLASQTFLGAIELYRQGDLTPEEWMNRVASKGGTTRAALNMLAAEDVSNKIIKGANAAYERAVELGKE